MNETGSYMEPVYQPYYTHVKVKKIIETCTQNEIVFDPQFMVSDAAESYTNSKVSNSYE